MPLACRFETILPRVTAGEYNQFFFLELDLPCIYFQLEVNPVTGHDSPNFEWGRGTDVQHSVEYMNWLNNYIKLPAGLSHRA